MEYRIRLNQHLNSPELNIVLNWHWIKLSIATVWSHDVRLCRYFPEIKFKFEFPPYYTCLPHHYFSSDDNLYKYDKYFTFIFWRRRIELWAIVSYCFTFSHHINSGSAIAWYSDNQ